MFGTDGMRGKVNSYPMTGEIALKFGMAVGIYLKKQVEPYEGRLNVIIAKDTRLSGYLLESSLVAGLVSIGIDCTIVGPMPTPTISKLIRSLRADFGIMITASHNHHHDNGFKLFDPNGEKLTENAERAISSIIEQDTFNEDLATPNKLGKVTRLDDARGRYIEHVKNALPRSISLQGLRIVIDCANGAAYKIGPTVFWELGATVVPIHNEPDGLNINHACGSMHPESLITKVIETRADIGIALDGDADRILICDENGVIIDGDLIIAIVFLDLMHRNKIYNNNIVITETSNQGLVDFMERTSTNVIRTKVGDRNVAHAMKEHRSSIGGEKSGHIIVSEYGMVSDGIVAGLHFLSYIITNEIKVSTIHEMFELYPQYNENIPYYGDNPLESEDIKKELDQLQKKYMKHRILVRKSGTERLIRIMVEGKNSHEVNTIGDSIKNMIVDKIAIKVS